MQWAENLNILDHSAYLNLVEKLIAHEIPDALIQYDGIVAEHEWTRSSASLFDVSHMGQLTVHSPEDNPELAARELEKLLPGRGV